MIGKKAGMIRKIINELPEICNSTEIGEEIQLELWVTTLGLSVVTPQ